MSFCNILIPTDGSEFTKNAVDKGLELAQLVGGKVTALYVVDGSAYNRSNADTNTNPYDTSEKEGAYATAYVEEKGREMGITVERKIVEGNPAKTILQESENYDIIVMGTLGRTGLSKLIMGSVAEKVIQNAKCPVLVVRSPGE
jgi:Universal stress protein UspA and related nucleotide-binding proteins